MALSNNEAFEAASLAGDFDNLGAEALVAFSLGKLVATTSNEVEMYEKLSELELSDHVLVTASNGVGVVVNFGTPGQP